MDMKPNRMLAILAAGALAAAAQALASQLTNTMNPDPVTVRLLDAAGSLTEPLKVPKVVKSDAAWRLQLSPEQFQITRTHGTERAFCGIFHDNHKDGVYACIGCGLPLFRSDAKFDSGTGWPSFFQPVAKENIGETHDTRYGMVRTEVHCVRCDSHLGHVFDDGPRPSGLRYCINSDALSFHERGTAKAAREKILFGAGCFWGVQEAFSETKGVTATRAGYSGGHTKNPSYQDVCSHKTGHAEVVEVEFDPVSVTLEKLLEVLWAHHNPFRPSRTGPDEGDQYRSAVFFYSPSQEAAARASASRLELAKAGQHVATEIGLAATFYPAEEYHQHYNKKHGLKGCPSQ